MRISNFIKTTCTALAISTAGFALTPTVAQTKPDTFERTVTPAGTADSLVLKNTPSPEIYIMGEKRNAVIVVDIDSHTLYKYDNEGNPQSAYLIASGKKSTPTQKGVRIITHIEKYPYRSAPKVTKRHKNPRAYGPNIICLNKINPQTGEQNTTGQFIHGNNDPSSLGKFASLGCIRMDNEVIKELAKQVKRGDIVIIK